MADAGEVFNKSEDSDWQWLMQVRFMTGVLTVAVQVRSVAGGICDRHTVGDWKFWVLAMTYTADVVRLMCGRDQYWCDRENACRQWQVMYMTGELTCTDKNFDIFRGKWHCSTLKGQYALQPVSPQSPQSCPQNNAHDGLVQHRLFLISEGGIYATAFPHYSFLQVINAVMIGVCDEDFDRCVDNERPCTDGDLHRFCVWPVEYQPLSFSTFLQVINTVMIWSVCGQNFDKCLNSEWNRCASSDQHRCGVSQVSWQWDMQMERWQSTGTTMILLSHLSDLSAGVVRRSTHTATLCLSLLSLGWGQTRWVGEL